MAKKNRSKVPADRTARRHDKFNKQVGQLIRNRRVELGLSQSALADHCNISFQQIQKYERGVNQVTLLMARILCPALRMSLSEFIEAADGEAGQTVSPLTEHEREAIAIAQIIQSIEDDKLRAVVRTVARALGGKEAVA